MAFLSSAQAQLSDEIDCVIYPSIVADLGSSTSGVISEIYVDRGDSVNKGDIIAALESDAETSALLLAKIRAASKVDIELQNTSIAFAERRQHRAQNLREPKLISESSIDEYETETRIGYLQLQRAIENSDLAKIELRRAQELLSRRTVYSPFNGVVLEKYKAVGELIENQPLVRLAKLNPLHVEVIVPASQLEQLEAGMQAQVRVADLEGAVWTATIDRIDSVADVASDTYGVRLELPNPDYTIPAGRRCLVRFTEISAPLELSRENRPHAPDATSTTVAANKNRQAPAIGAAFQQTEAGLHYPDAPEQKYMTNGSNCQWVGPLDNLATARQLQGNLKKNGHSAYLVEHSSKKERGTVVVSALQPSRQHAETLLAKLHDAGFSDVYLPESSTERQIALGAFEDSENAERLRRSLSEHGIEAELHAWKKTTVDYYIAAHSAAINNQSTTTTQVPILSETIPLRNEDGTFRDEHCNNYVK